VSSLRRVGSKAPALPILKKDNHCEAGASLLSPTEAGASAEHNRSLNLRPNMLLIPLLSLLPNITVCPDLPKPKTDGTIYQSVHRSSSILLLVLFGFLLAKL